MRNVIYRVANDAQKKSIPVYSTDIKIILYVCVLFYCLYIKTRTLTWILCASAQYNRRNEKNILQNQLKYDVVLFSLNYFFDTIYVTWLIRYRYIYKTSLVIFYEEIKSRRIQTRSVFIFKVYTRVYLKKL